MAAGEPVGHAELVVLGDDDLAGVGPAGRALRVAADLEGPERLLERVEDSSRPTSGSPSPRSILMASRAWIEPTMPGSTPSTPASAHDGASSAGGGSGIMQR